MNDRSNDGGVVPEVRPNFINFLPPDLLKMTFAMLPASHIFVSPVCRLFRDLYAEASPDENIYGDKKTTYRYSISTEASLELYLKQKKRGEEWSYVSVYTNKRKKIEKYSHEDRYSEEYSSFGPLWNDREKEITIIGAGCGREDWMRRSNDNWFLFCFNRARRAAARAGQLRILKLICTPSTDLEKKIYICREAARGGHIDVLRWAREEGSPWDATVCMEAARGGRLEVLRWLRSEGCPWDEYTCSEAARHGRLEILKWARENGCDWDYWTCCLSFENERFEILRWTLENGCPYIKYHVFYNEEEDDYEEEVPEWFASQVEDFNLFDYKDYERNGYEYWDY